MGGPMPGRAGKQDVVPLGDSVGEGTTPGGLPLPLFLAPALPEIGPAEQYLVDLYDRTYSRLPWKKAAERYRWALQEARQAIQQGDEKRATETARNAAALQAVLDKHTRCRRCGRHLHHPASVAAGIGPECKGKAL